MQVRAQTELIAAVLAITIAAAVLLRARKRRIHWLFVAFAGNVSVWYFALFLDAGHNGPWWGRATGLAAVLLPQSGIRFLRAFFVETPGHRSRLFRVAAWLGGVLTLAVLSPWHGHPVVRSALSLYVVGLFGSAALQLWQRGSDTSSRLEAARGRYLAAIAAITTIVFGADVLPFAGIDMGPTGSALVLVVLFLLSQVMERSRLIALYELAARLFGLTALAFVLAGIYYALVDWPSGHRPYVLNAIVASLVILMLFDPLRANLEAQISRVFFRERFDLERAMNDLHANLAHQLELGHIGKVLMDGLQSSRRVTHASFYLVDAEQRALDLFVHFGPAPVSHVELAAARPLLERMRAKGAAVVGQIAREAEAHREANEVNEAVVLDEANAVCELLGANVVLPIPGAGDSLLGLLALGDDRMRDAFSPEEVQTLRQLAAQLAVAVENSRQHGQIKDRDRLAALGEMAAGLAHEIRNPLGSIKAAAELIEGAMPRESTELEYVGIITEEVARLNRVVTSFLDYARPFRGNAQSVDVVDAVRRTAAILRGDLPSGIRLTVQTDGELPAVKIDVEHLRQVLMNLVRNAVDAMDGNGSLAIVTQRHAGRTAAVEIVVRDTGPGIEPEHLPSLFVPFFTTKSQGTGLGLAICQRLITSAGGRIEVRTTSARGTTFVIVLPVASERGTVENEGGMTVATA